ncbi:MAG: glycosyl transferase family protein [Gammaproteobacteria bacterium]|nr:glycosyl transferase family protein [Gammaproteobacteria bacterium]
MNKFSHHLQTDSEEHPFAKYIRILGRGKKGVRALTQDEAYIAMKMIMADAVLPEQLGAFLMLMRIKEETPEELAGFVVAAREFCIISVERSDSPFDKLRTNGLENQNHAHLADLDWSTYAGKRRHLPWFILSALLLADNGIKVFMHGAEGPSSSRLYTETALSHLGINAATSPDQVAEQLQNQQFSYFSLAQFCPLLQKIIDLRPILGLRSPVHTLVRMLNPANAPYSMQGIFHPSYRAVHQHAAALLGQPHMAVLKGEGGETERNPDMDCLVQSVHHGELSEEIWPALFPRRHVRAESLNPELLRAVWQGDISDEFGEAAVIGTVAVALTLLGKASNQQRAQILAQEYWNERDRQRFT